MAPVKVEDISDKGDGTPSEKEKEPLFQLTGSATDASAKEIQGGDEAPPQNANEKKVDEVEKKEEEVNVANTEI